MAIREYIGRNVRISIDGKLIESFDAVALPSAKPRTGDMTEMVEHLHRLGEVRKRPAAFRMAGVTVVHPALLQELRADLSRRMDVSAFAVLRGDAL